MNALSRWLGRYLRSAVEGSYRLDEAGALTVFGATPDASGMNVTERTSMSSAAVFACVRLISQTIGSCPIDLFETRSDGAKIRATSNPLYGLLANSPSDAMTPMTWEQTAVANLLLWGNHYSYLDKSGPNPRIKRIVPLPPELVTPDFKDNYGTEIVYKFAGQRGYDSIPKVIRTDEILHFVGLCHDGLKGLSVINAHRDTVGRDLAERRFGASYFGASARPGGVLKTDKTLDPPARKKLKEMWESGHQGPTQFHRTAILDGGLTYEPEKMSAADAQYVEQMQFSLQEIARIFGVPLVLLQSPEKGANYGGGIEQLMLMFSTFTLRPYMVSIEQELRRKLLPAAAGSALFFKHDMKELLRADIKTRFEAHAAARQWGIASLNDVRREEDYPPIDEPWADQLMVPVNMTSADKLGQATAAPAPKGASSPLAPSSFPRAAVAPVLLRDLKLLVQREVKALRSALEKRTLAEFLEWLPDYYLTFEKFANDLCGESFAAASGETSAAWAAQLAEASLQEIRRSAEKSVNLSIDTKSAFQLLFEDWLEHKADRTAEAVIQEGAAHGTRA